MPRYKNVAATPWRRPSGEAVPPGGIFDANLREHERIVRRGYQGRLQLVDVDVVQALKAAAAPLPAAGTPAAARLQDWPLRMPPEVYLKLHPEGKHAALAETLVKAAAPEEA